ncbi:sodium:proton antiporter [Bacteroidia bacterium]|jgi:Co/Zn/Cd efflux system component|nr:sodium:proton antiporter [Bacteroidia bacterium]
MKETIFEVPKMDCPSEERIIRMALESESSVKTLNFDLAGRRLKIFHECDAESVLARLAPLNFGAAILSSRVLSEPEEALGIPISSDSDERAVLQTVFVINAVMFFAELILGWIAQSTGLIADSLDMFADAAVFALSLYAVGRAVSYKKNAARLSGILQMILGLGALSEVVRRYFIGSEPESKYMITVAGAALVANAFCMRTLAKHRNGELHMRASWIFLSTDVIANAGVVLAGILVYFTSSQLPDLVVGALIAAIVLRGSVRILRLASA